MTSRSAPVPESSTQTGRTHTFGLVRAPLTAPLLDGHVHVPLATFHAVSSVDEASRAMCELRFDVGEMSFATYLRARADGKPLIALTVFTGRRFLQPGILVRTDSKLDDPAQLRGRTVGTSQYWMTSSVWHRGILAEYHGVDAADLAWVTAADERLASLRVPESIRARRLPAGASLESALLAGDVDALLLPGPGKSGAPAAGLRYLHPDVVAAQRTYHARSQVLPIMHLVVMRADLAEDGAMVVGLRRAFEDAKRYAQARGELGSPIVQDTPAAASALLGEDAYPYGLIANERALAVFLRYALEQDLVTPAPRAESLFADR